MTKYNSHEMIRGQQGDPWKGQVPWPDFPDTLARRKTSENWRHDWINRQFITSEEEMPQKKTVDCGLDFIERNASYDNWFLQIEVFDPHEPFYTQQEYKNLVKPKSLASSSEISRPSKIAFKIRSRFRPAFLSACSINVCRF